VSDSEQKRPATKRELLDKISEKAGVGRKEAEQVLDALQAVLADELGQDGPGLVTIPGLLKVKRVRKPATEEKQGVNPMTKTPMTIKAKPARSVIKVVPLKQLKGLAS